MREHVTSHFFNPLFFLFFSFFFRTLDPPLRSRFQSRVVLEDDISPPPFSFPHLLPAIDAQTYKEMLTFSEALKAASSEMGRGGEGLVLPPFPNFAITKACGTVGVFPSTDLKEAVAR